VPHCVLNLFSQIIACLYLVSTIGNPPPPPLVEPPAPEITDFVEDFSCNFDSGLCGMTQDTDETADYTLNSGPTINRYTGPSQDHTSGEGNFVISSK